VCSSDLLGQSAATSVADLGCGEGRLLALLLRHKRFTRLIGLDASARTLERAASRLKLDRPGAPAPERLTLLHGALTYRDARWKDVDAAALVEVIEHLDADRLPALADVVFGQARPRLVVVTTPNAEHNVLFEGMAPGALRHPDHRFEWTRAQFRDWVGEIATRYGYAARYEDIGDSHPEHGAPTQMAVLTR
jgi:3' terminal RNA ribose 2'-O-methyltransferase Hen1